MRKLYFFAAAIFASSFLLAQQAYFLSYPCLSPDGQTVVFSFEGDLWKADVNNGQASRITAMQGYETNARISPDGKWLAFTGSQFGNTDVYVMPMVGGSIDQLTWHSGGDDVDSWSWDSKDIYFTSNRYSRYAGYTVSRNGGTPRRVFGSNYFQYDHNLLPHPVTGEIFFDDTWESGNQLQRKRYKGPFNPEIQSYDFKTKQVKKYTSWQGKDFGATIDKAGNIYFISDEANNEYNLYTMKNGKATALTNFSSSIKNARVSANGKAVVFEKDYQLWLYDVDSRKSRKLDITVTRNSILPKDKDFDVKGNIGNLDVSPDGKKLAFVSRGEIFVSDVEGKFISLISKGPAERTLEVKWLKDNRTLLYNQTHDGYQNWFTISADGTGTPKQITNTRRNNRSLVMNTKRTMAAYLSGRDELRLIDLATMTDKLLVKDEIWGFQNSDPAFSPNDEYVLFTAYRNFEQDILVHHIKQNKTINLTNTAITEADPKWSADGKYIYFESSRLKAAYPTGMQEPSIYRLPLDKIDEPFRSDKFDELFKEEKKDTTATKDSAKAAPVAPPKNIVINTERMMERLQLVSTPFGSQYLAGLYQKGDKTTVLYVSDHGEGKRALWKTVIEPFEENKTEKINGTDNARGLDLVIAGDKLYVVLNGNINKLNLDQNKLEPVNISYTFRRNLQQEFAQEFEEAWAQVEENYYDENFHGTNWPAVKKYYEKFIPYLNNRGDLRVMLNDMLGELNSSHQGFNTSGDDEKTDLVNRTMETGIIFSNDEPYRVERVAERSNADKSTIDVKPGDILVKVNNIAVAPQTDRSYYFTRPSLDKELTLTFRRNGKENTVTLHPQPSLQGNLYDEWIDANQQRVNARSKSRIAYSCMKNMGNEELENFLVDMTQELVDKDGLILDLRYNTGGNVHDAVLNFLGQRSYLKWKYREGALTPQPNFAPADKPIVLLINEQSLSDAEMTAAGFKELKLGKIIGNETYRWIIFTSAVRLVDGSVVRMPAWGCYTLDGKDLEMTGVQPDIKIINSFEDRLSGNDPQLERAIQEILKAGK